MPTTIIPTEVGDTSTHRLYGWVEDWDEAKHPVLAATFGHLYRLAVPEIGTDRGYPGDLFHDATWLDAHVHGPIEFFWCVDEYGTHINTEPGGLPSEHLSYRIALHHTVKDGEVRLGDWSLTITRIAANTRGETVDVRHPMCTYRSKVAA